MDLEITPATRLFALLGDPVEHSLSPKFQNAALGALRLDGAYLALRCSTADVAGLVRGIARAGGGGNVTIPHKATAADAVEYSTEAVNATGVCNTFWLDNGKVCGDNTDVTGVSEAVRDLLGRDAAGARVLLLGAGGSARATGYAMLCDGADQLVVLNRTPERGHELRSVLCADSTVVVAASVAELRGESFDLVINATSLGLRPEDPLPLAGDAEIEFAAALDLVYSPDSTAWVRALRAGGIRAADGREMLLRQGAASFQRWWGREAPLDAMRAALSLASG